MKPPLERQPQPGKKSFRACCELVEYALSLSRSRGSAKTIETAVKEEFIKSFGTDPAKMKFNASTHFLAECMIPELARRYCAVSRLSIQSAMHVSPAGEEKAIQYLTERYGDCIQQT